MENLNDWIDHAETNPLRILQTMAELAIEKGVYRLQRNDQQHYPNVHMDGSEKAILNLLYKQFEEVWQYTYDLNPYSFLTDGRCVKGPNSEVTIYHNPQTNLLHISYTIAARNGAEGFSYPIAIPTEIQTKDPQVESVLYLESWAQHLGVDHFYDDNVRYWEKDLPEISTKWTQLKNIVRDRLTDSAQNGNMPPKVWDDIQQLLKHPSITVAVSDDESGGYPCVTLHSNDQADVAQSINILMAGPEFVFRHDRYAPFMDLSDQGIA